MAVDFEEQNCAWNVITAALSPQHGASTISDTQLGAAINVIQKYNYGPIVEGWYLESLQQDLRQRIAPAFWDSFMDNSECLVSQLCSSIQRLNTSLLEYQRCTSICSRISQSGDPSSDVKIKVEALFKSVIFYCTPKHFDNDVNQFYSLAFKVFRSQGKDEDCEEEGASTASCSVCTEKGAICQCQDILNKFHLVNRLLNELGLLERVCGESITNICHQQIKQHITHLCKGNFETSYMLTLEKWLEKKVVGWLAWVYEGTSTTSQNNVESFHSRLHHFLSETYADARIRELFDIIIEFPESEPAILDLKTCLEKTDLRSTLLVSLKNALETRLLHPGVNTADILTAYISAIRALRVLDPTGVILELVCEPVRKYLRNRNDTVRCIVSSLTEEGSSDLSDELCKAQPLVLDESYHSDDVGEDWEHWVPDPVDADPGKTSKSRRSSDIISMLVNIYGSKELFVNEYRNLLADRILTQFSYDTEKEIRYLELLKLRFGEAQLHYCEVMLKDVADSRRINHHITDAKNKKMVPDEGIPVNAMVLSAQFWPSFREEKIELPEELQSSLDTYTKAFETLKGNRTLSWKPHLGLMNVEIELKDRKIELNVSPVHATILWYFQEKPKWTIEELGKVMHMPSSALRRKITFWQSQGILKEEATDTFTLLEEQKGRHHDIVVVEDDEIESAMASSQDQREEELQVYWSYIVGMLTNLESLPLERIHSMLKMFAMQGPTTSECSIPELKAFLDRKVKEQKLIYSGGVYRLAGKGGS